MLNNHLCQVGFIIKRNNAWYITSDLAEHFILAQDEKFGQVPN